MELIIFIAVVVVAALLWSGYVKTKKAESESKIDSWIPGGPGKNPDQHPLARFNTDADADKPWPYGEKIAEGKIHVKTTDVLGSENRVEEPAPVAEIKPTKKPAVKKTAAKPAVSKKTPAKKKSV